jgi:hypothetical protein
VGGKGLAEGETPGPVREMRPREKWYWKNFKHFHMILGYREKSSGGFV